MGVKKVIEDTSSGTIEGIEENVIELYSELRDFLEEEYSYELYECHETLLGTVRGKGLTLNDGKFNCAYVSKENKEDKVIEEFKTISKILIKNGYCLKVSNSHIQVSKEESSANINIYCSWLNENSRFMTDSDMNEIYWEQYYLNSKLQKASSFCSFINNFITEKYLVLDIGCGSARDSFEFAQHGHDVIGLDRSEQAIMFANSLIKEEKYKNISFEIVDISDETLMSELFKRSKEQAKQKQKNIIYYSRFFLHSIDDDSQKQLLKAISNYIDSGDLFIAEFRTKEDEIRQKIYSNHYRRFLDEQELLAQLKEICNMDKLLLFQKGTGFSIYKDEDPFLARIIVEKD